MISLLVAALLATASPADTVYTVDGGRVVGNVLEESPSSGVSVQMPDGSVRRIGAGQVVRIEYSDGTVSEARPAAPAAAAAVAPPVPAPLPSGPPDTVYFAGGGRVRGTVIQEDARTGVKIRLLDGSLHTYPPEEFSRIEYADGTVSRRKTSETAAAAPAPAARAQPVEAAADTIYFIGGGRVRGTVIEEHPSNGVRIRQLDGSLHTYSRDELVRIEYADGTVSRRKTPPPQPPPPTAQPVAATPPPQPPPAEERIQPAPLYLTLGAGVSFFGGEAERNVSMQQLFETQGHVSSEIGLRFSPAWAIGVYGDVGGGDVAAPVRDQCQRQGLECLGATGRLGVLLRHTWDPLSSRSKWLSLGTGWEMGNVSVDHHDGSSDLFTYSGREYLRLGAGIDFRSNDVLGIGLYASFAWGQYDEYQDLTGVVPLDQRTHTTGQVGLRLTLFP
jgi:hypothetical protein